MDGQEYLNQISATSKPAKKSMSGIFKSKFFIVGMVGIVGFIIIMIFGMILGSGKGGEKDVGYALKLHLDNTSEIIKTYQSDVRSSNLRSSSASLYGLLTNVDRELTTYLTEKYKIKENQIEKKINKKIVKEATEAKDALSTELFGAKINGILDRIYAHKMAYEISLLITEEGKMAEITKDTALKESLETSCRSLENLYESFSGFSETK